MKKHLFLFISFLILCCYSCNNEQYAIPPQIVTADKKIDINDETELLLKSSLESINASGVFSLKNDTLYSIKFVSEFYLANNYRPIWFNDGLITPLGDSLYNLIDNADKYGLISNDYHIGGVKRSIDNIHLDKNKIDISAIVESEILMTDAFYTFCVHVSSGRLNKDSLTKEWKENEKDSIFVSLLDSAINKKTIRTIFDSIEPQGGQYKLLKKALAHFKSEFESNNWDTILNVSDSKLYETFLIKRLSESHDYFPEYSGSESEKLTKAIKNFQCRHNLLEDGKIGNMTHALLLKTKQDYIRQIEVNMERWRYYNQPKENAYVWINVPTFEMNLIENDSIILKSRIIVGADTTPTPVLKSAIQYFLIYPYWNVPYKIAVNEILPILKKNPHYLQHKNFEVLDRNGNVITSPIQWKKYNKLYFPFKIRQRMGEDNALGLIKFYFNNKKGVYLHDTGNRNLFNLQNRALSHGCIRLEKYFDFACYLIKNNDSKYNVDSLKHDLLNEKQKFVYLKHPLPIYINYFTAEVNNYGEIRYLMDVYNRDDKMIKELYKN